MQTIQPTGHHNDGSGVQKHSAGGIYPYVLGVRDRRVNKNLVPAFVSTEGVAWFRYWFLTGGHLVDDLSFSSYDEAVAAANGFNALRAKHASERAQLVLKHSIENGVAAAFNRIGQHNQREWQRFAHQRNSR